MDERKKDFSNLMLAFKSHKFTPKQLGSLFRQYHVKWEKPALIADLKSEFENFVASDNSGLPDLDTDVSMLDGRLPY